MKIYKYPFYTKIVYQYANIPVTVMLLVYLYFSVNALFYSWTNIFPIVINVALIYTMNRFYLRTYRTFPFKIEADDTKIICSDFPFSRKIVQIKFENIDDVTGGIFGGIEMKPINIHDSENNTVVAFSTRLSGFKELLSTVLSNVRKDVYKRSIERFIRHREGLMEKH